MPARRRSDLVDGGSGAGRAAGAGRRRPRPARTGAGGVPREGLSDGRDPHHRRRRGRQAAWPCRPAAGTRPTSDRAREGLFATILAIRGPLDGARALDLYAGSGAVGLEALSRGASDVLLVEADARAARVIRGNIEALRLPGARLLAGTGRAGTRPRAPAITRRAMSSSPTRPTPRRTREVERMLAALRDRGWLAPGAAGGRGAGHPVGPVHLARRVYARAVPRLR